MKRLLAVLLFMLGLTVLLTLSVAAEDSTATFYKGDSVYATETLDGTHDLTLPACSDADRIFVGWRTDSAEGSVLYPVGTTVTLPEGNSDFYAVLIDLRTLTGAAVSVGSPTTLRFDGAISAADHAALAELVGAEQITVGMLIAPASQVFDATVGGTVLRKDVAAEGLLDRIADLERTANGYALFSGRTEAIPDEMLLESFAARAYLTVATVYGEITVYARFDAEKHERMAHFVTAKAFEDRTERRDSSHIYTTESVKSHYAAYPEQTLARLEDRLDKVISVSQWNSQTQSVDIRIANEYAKNIYGTFTEFLFYTSPYRVDRVLEDDPRGFDTYVIVANEGADFRNVKAYFIGHSYRPPSANEWKEDGIYLAVRNETGAPR